VSLNRRDSDFIYKLAASPPNELRGEDMARAVVLFHELAPRPGTAFFLSNKSKGFFFSIQFLSLLLSAPRPPFRVTFAVLSEPRSLPGDKIDNSSASPYMPFLQLLRVLMTYPGWVVPKKVDPKTQMGWVRLSAMILSEVMLTTRYFSDCSEQKR